jgi:hypothetical protein
MADIDTNVNEVETKDTDVKETNTNDNISSEIAKLRAEVARQKAALDKATKEAGDYRKQLRAKQSEEEIAAAEKQVADEERDRKLAEYEKRFTVAETSKKIMSFVGDEKTSTTLAEFLFGAADIDSAVEELNKAWIAKEKKLRAEYGRITAPGVGGTDGGTITKEQLDMMTYTERIKFATNFPDEYEKLMGRK